MKIKDKKIEALKYAKNFCDYLISEQPIYDSKLKREFTCGEDEYFKQCYADTVTRNQFPAFWFVSNKGNLLSIISGKITWLKKNRRKNGSVYYKFRIKKTDSETIIKNIEMHNLVALVFESESYGCAAKLLSEKGINAFGVKNTKELRVNGHHKDSDRNNNMPKNIQLLSTKAHTLLDSIPKSDASMDKHIEFMKKFADIAEKEAPEKISVVFPGYSINAETGKIVKSEKSIVTFEKLTKETAMQIAKITQYIIENLK